MKAVVCELSRHQRPSRGNLEILFFSSEVSGQWSEDSPNLPPFKLSIHKKSGSLRTSNWCPYIRIAWHHLNLPHAFFHVAQDTPFAQGSPPPPFAPGLRPPVGPRPLRPRGYFSWKGQCQMLPWLPWYFLPKWALSYYIQYIQFDNDEPNKNTHLFLTNPKLVSTLSFVACVSR